MTTTEVKAALETLHNPLVYNQALTDCRNLLNLSLETLLAHFQQWLWSEEAPQEGSGEFEYYLQLGFIEQALVLKGVIYEGG